MYVSNIFYYTKCKCYRASFRKGRKGKGSMGEHFIGGRGPLAIQLLKCVVQLSFSGV